MKAEQRYIAIEGQASSSEEAIRLCAEALYQAGYVGREFFEACIKREKEYPTGLCTEIPIAIPHCQSETIKKNGVCYLRLDKPVAFRQMDDEREVVWTKNIFSIAIKDAGEHLNFLQKMMRGVTDTEFLKRLEHEEILSVPELLEHNL